MKKKQERQLLFDRSKYNLVILGLAITALGFILMIGGGSDDPGEFSYKLFNFRRLTLAPILVIAGYGLQVYAIMKNKKDNPEVETPVPTFPKQVRKK
jgi:hypothetical protein